MLFIGTPFGFVAGSAATRVTLFIASMLRERAPLPG